MHGSRRFPRGRARSLLLILLADAESARLKLLILWADRLLMTDNYKRRYTLARFPETRNAITCTLTTEHNLLAIAVVDYLMRPLRRQSQLQSLPQQAGIAGLVRLAPRDSFLG